MEKRVQRKIQEAKDAARPELKGFGWDALHLNERFPLDSSICKNELERIDANSITLEEFVNRYEKPYRPIILTNTQTEWKANEKWTFERLAKKYRNQKFKVGEDNEGCSVKMKMKYFMEYLKNQTDDSPLYLFDSSFGEVN